MAWHGLQKCRAEGAFGILMSMYDGVWYRLVEEGGSIVEVSHHDAPSTGQKKERTFTESEVKAMLDELKDANRALSELQTIARRHGISLDPA